MKAILHRLAANLAEREDLQRLGFLPFAEAPAPSGQGPATIVRAQIPIGRRLRPTSGTEAQPPPPRNGPRAILPPSRSPIQSQRGPLDDRAGTKQVNSLVVLRGTSHLLQGNQIRAERTRTPVTRASLATFPSFLSAMRRSSRTRDRMLMKAGGPGRAVKPDVTPTRTNVGSTACLSRQGRSAKPRTCGRSLLTPRSRAQARIPARPPVAILNRRGRARGARRRRRTSSASAARPRRQHAGRSAGRCR